VEGVSGALAVLILNLECDRGVLKTPP